MIKPWYLNFFHNIATVQFVHRMLAWLLIVLVPSFWLWLRVGTNTVRWARAESTILLGTLVIQIALGITTLLTGVALPFAAAHQAGAVILFATALWNAHVCGRTTRSPVPVITHIKTLLNAPIGTDS